MRRVQVIWLRLHSAQRTPGELCCCWFVSRVSTIEAGAGAAGVGVGGVIALGRNGDGVRNGLGDSATARRRHLRHAGEAATVRSGRRRLVWWWLSPR